MGKKAEASLIEDEFLPYEEHATDLQMNRMQQQYQQEHTVSENEEENESEYLEDQTYNVDLLDKDSNISNESLLDTK